MFKYRNRKNVNSKRGVFKLAWARNIHQKRIKQFLANNLAEVSELISEREKTEFGYYLQDKVVAAIYTIFYLSAAVYIVYLLSLWVKCL